MYPLIEPRGKSGGVGVTVAWACTAAGTAAISIHAAIQSLRFMGASSRSHRSVGRGEALAGVGETSS